jgi:hypothetical protein
MDEIQRKKLLSLVTQRADKVQSIERFNEYFSVFVRQHLRMAVSEISSLLISTTNESLKLFLEDPYKISNTRHFAMIQLVYGNNLNTFFLDNTKHFPSLIFEGDEFTGKVKLTTKIKENAFSSTELEIIKLDERLTYELLINFLDQIYKQ